MKQLTPLRSSVRDLTPQERIEIARVKLRKLHPVYKEAEQNLRNIQSEITYWANLKFTEEYNLTTVTKVPSLEKIKRRVSNKRVPTLNELLKSITSMTQIDKDKLRSELLG